MTNRRKHIVALPRWYPNKTDIQLGIFNQRQLLLLKEDLIITVIYVQPVEDQIAKFEQVTERISNTFTERIIYYRNAKGPFRKITNFIRFNRAQKVGIAKVKEKIDAFYVQVPYRTALPAYRSFRKFKTPFYITEHWSGHLNGLYQKKNKLDQCLFRFIVKRAKSISTVSPALQKAFTENTGFDSILIPNLIEKTNQLSQINKVSSSVIRILSVGDMVDKIKNQSSLLIAFSEALKEDPNLHLTLIGGGPDEDKIKQMANELMIPTQNILFTGRQNHTAVLKAMHSCDFYICNSRHETFGMTIAEALMSGKPVISTKCGGPEEFLDPSNCLLIPVAGTGKIDPALFKLTGGMNKDQSNYPELFHAIKTMAMSFQNYNSTEISEKIEAQFGEDVIRQKWLAFFES